MKILRHSVQLLGNLGRDVQFQRLDNGSSLARVSLATREVFRNAQGEKVVHVQWHQLVGRGKTAETMYDLLQKGREVALKSKLAHRIYEGRDGRKRFRSEVVVNEFMLMNRS